MAPKPSYQLLIWSIPTAAFLLTCLWYRRKRNSLRSDPGGTASIDLTALLLKTSDSLGEPAHAQSEPDSEDSHEIKLDETFAYSAADAGNTEVIKTSDLLKEVEADVSVILCREDPCKQKNAGADIEDRSLEKESLGSFQIAFPAKENSVFQVVEVLENIETDHKVSENQRESKEETACKDIGDCKSDFNQSKLEVKCEETEKTDHEEGRTLAHDSEKSEQVVSISDRHLSEKLSGATCDKIVDIVNLQEVEESISVSKPASGSVVNSDTVLAELLLPVEKLCVSSSDKCVVTNSAEPECVVEDSACTVSNPPSFEDCGVSDSALTEQHLEGAEAEASVGSSVSESELVDEASCSNSSVTTERTVMARKSSLDLAMEKNADSDGSATHRECKLSVSDQRNSSTENAQVERDSANHSPADVMLGSPAISNYSDVNSEGSSDSGKGCSDMATPPPRTPVSGSSLVGDVPSIYEFVLPQHLVGRLIGRFGAFVHQIKDKTNANILIKRHPDTTKLKICAIEGNQMSIDRALEMIRDKFPQKKYPNVTLEQVFFVPATPVFPVPQCVQLRLVEGVNNDVIVSYMVTPAHVFLQQPTHPTFLNLSSQAAYMQACYSEPSVPALPRPVSADVICVAPVMGDWCRAQVVTDEAEDGMCTIRLLDYGGYDVVDCSVLRQIRHDFMLLPFQAAEAYLANISPTGGVDEEWSQEAFDVLEELTKGQVVEAQVVGYAENSVPIVHLYSIVRSKAIFVNYELVKRGLATWIEGCTVVNGNGIAADDAGEESCQVVAAEQ